MRSESKAPWNLASEWRRSALPRDWRKRARFRLVSFVLLLAMSAIVHAGCPENLNNLKRS